MPQETDTTRTGADRLQAIFVKPPVSAEDLTTDTEYDPEGAQEFVALIRALRNESPRPVHF